MSTLRAVMAGIALLAFAAGLNAWVVLGDFARAPVVLLLLAGAAAGIVALALTLVLASDRVERGRTLFGLNAIFVTGVFFGICAILFAFAKRWDLEWDLTQEGRRELSEQTKQVLQALNEDVIVYGLFIEAADAISMQTRSKTARFLDRCQALTPWLKVEFLDPQLEAERMKQLDLTIASKTGTVVLRCGTNQRVIPIPEVTSRLEERDFINALINVTRESQPRVYFLTGHQEKDITNADPKEGATGLAQLLESESYRVDVTTIDLTNPSLPPDCNVLIINAPEYDFRPAEIATLQDYIDNGGRLLMLLDVWGGVDTSGGRTEYLRPWLEKSLGIAVGMDVIMQGGEQPNANLALIPDFGIFGGSFPDVAQRGSFHDEHPITRGFGQNMQFIGARTVRKADQVPANVQVTELLHTTPNTWSETDLVRFREGLAAPDQHEAKGPIAVAVAAIAGNPVTAGEGAASKEARVVVVGNRAFTNNEQIRIQSHRNLMLNTMAWLTEQADLIAIRPVGTEDDPIVLSPQEEQWIAWVTSLGIVQIVVIAGIVVFVLRRKYR